MIEVVYSGEEHEEQDEVRIPKNIHQIGNNSSNKKIYIEDYVMTYLKKSPSGEDNVKYGVLLGDVKRAKGNVYIFVKGMVEVRDVIENSIIFNDDIWSGIYKDIKQFFEQLNIVGWYVSVPYRVSEDMNRIRKIHLDNFAGNDKVCFVKDRAENEEGFYSYEQSGLGKQQGYYIYYEKNEKMKKYVKNLKNSVTNSGIANNEIKNISVDDKIGGEDKKDKKSSKNKLENIELKAEEANGKTIKISKEESKQDNNLNKKDLKNKEKSQWFKNSKSTNNTVEETGEPIRQGRIAYGVSGLLIVALLLSTVVMLNNYGELKNIKSTLAGISREREAQAVNKILSAYTETTKQSATTVAGLESKKARATNGSNVTQKNNDNGEVVSKQTAGTNQDNNSSNNSITNTTNDSNNTKSNKPSGSETENNKTKSISSAYSGQYHTVKPGQTLYDISMSYYGTSEMVDEIKDRNNIDDDYTIKEGQKILLP